MPELNFVAMHQLRRVINDAPDDKLHMQFIVDKYAKCGTARCAIGWCLVDEWFMDPANTGLRGIFGDDFDGHGFDKLHLLEAEFGLDRCDCGLLFAYSDGGLETAFRNYGEHAVTKEMVLHNIDLLLDGRSAVPYRAMIDDQRAGLAFPVSHPKTES